MSCFKLSKESLFLHLMGWPYVSGLRPRTGPNPQVMDKDTVPPKDLVHAIAQQILKHLGYKHVQIFMVTEPLRFTPL